MIIGVGIGSSENAILDYLCLGYIIFLNDFKLFLLI
jgi:hypothetical protein